MRYWQIPGPDQDWFTKEETAEQLDTSGRSLDRLINTGQFPRGTLFGPGGQLWWSGLDIAVYHYLRQRCLDPEKNGEEPAATES